MNISRREQRVLHALAQGGCIRRRRCPNTGRIVAADCFTRDGHVLSHCTLGLFRKLKRRGLIANTDGQLYRATRLRREPVRGQPDNR